MKLFRFVPRTDDFGCLDNSGDWASFRKGVPVKSWRPVKVKYVPHGKKMGDFPGLFRNIPVFSKDAWEALKDLVEPGVQACEIDTKEGPCFVINVLAIDCLDKDKSSFVYYPNGTIMRIEAYVFRKGSIENQHMFKIPESVGLEAIVTEDFVNAIEEKKLAGARFEFIAEV